MARMARSRCRSELQGRIDTVKLNMAEPIVREFRQILLWPVQLIAANDRQPVRKDWEALQQTEHSSWKKVRDELAGDAHLFQERGYREFVTFLPYVQRFLYGDELGRGSGAYGESPMQVYR